MDLIELTKWLKARRIHPLPGKTAHHRMSSLSRIRKMQNTRIPESAIQSGVLILVYLREDKTKTVLMRRPQYEGVHGGQISLPGGKSEDSDKCIIDTAIREAHEEIGIDPAKVVILGTLTPLYIPPSNYIVTPVLGFYNESPEFTADTKEVAEIIEISLEELRDCRNVQRKKVKINQDFTLVVPSYFINNNVIWGATAMILSEFKELLKEFEVLKHSS